MALLVLRRTATVALLALGALLLAASPAGADPPQPTSYRSEVLRLDPDVEGVTAEVVGGDGFLLLEVEEGTTVEVPDYSGDDPYLRFRADGRVEENLSSGASQINDARNPGATTSVAVGEPRWETVATDGRWAWHDHRIHNMADRVPPAARTPEGVPWTVPIVVDGVDVAVEGRYVRVADPSPWPWVVLGLGTAALGLLLLPRLVSPLSAAGLSCLLGGAAATAVAVAQRAADPPGAPTSPLVVILPIVAVIGGVIAVMQRGSVLRGVAALAGAASLGSWAVLRAAVLIRAELPTEAPFALDRAVTAASLGCAVAAAVLVIRSGALAPAPLDLDESPPPSPPAE